MQLKAIWSNSLWTHKLLTTIQILLTFKTLYSSFIRQWMRWSLSLHFEPDDF